ncbi:MAG: microsomal dipeptidase-like Zn-dependent dipeptidase [Flavobacteriales bacterium]|jgi:microsomal dipeptidase-like Zn-dependent dipeptidase
MRLRHTIFALPLSAIFACSSSIDDVSDDDRSNDSSVYDVALGCFTVGAEAPDSGDAPRALVADGEAFAFAADGEAARFFLKPSDLATYLFYDDERRYLVAPDGGTLARLATLDSDILLVEDDFLPGAQWVLESATNSGDGFHLRHFASGTYLTLEGAGGALADAAVLTLTASEGCAEHPELSLDASGAVEPRVWEDGSVFGFAEPHTHLMTNFGFGGGGIFHGSPFHPLGVEHALSDCERFHGPGGRADLLSFGFSNRASFETLLQVMIAGEAPEDDHETDGYPTFTDWPDAPESPSHQTQYYRAIERAYHGGLRLMVQHATSYSVLCELVVGEDIQPTRYSCNDMVAVDRILEETRHLERYIDAHHGGPGEGWFRIVETPEQARQVINDGKLAVVLGIEISNLFDCFVTPEDGTERCTEADVMRELDTYQARGVRVLFPNHKTDNAFTPGDGSRGVFELANFVETGHWSNFSEDGCPGGDTGFDDGQVDFGGLNEPRDEYLAPPAVDLTGFTEDPVGWVLAFAGRALPDRIDGEFCQQAGFTDIGEFLLQEMMRRGLVIELDHLPQRSYQRAFELLEANDYPGVGTHGRTNGGRLFDLQGLGKAQFARCARDDQGRDAARLDRQEQMEDLGHPYPYEPMSFDLNGLAGANDGRFDDENPCSDEQTNPVTYPFTSYAGDVEFTQPRMAARVIDYNTEGFVHLGMLPELIEDLRNTGVSDESIDGLFRSAEAWIRVWERSLERGGVLSGE